MKNHKERPGVSGKNKAGETWINKDLDQEQKEFIGIDVTDEYQSNDRIHKDIYEALMKDPDLDPSLIGVKVEDGIINLEGKVKHRYKKRVENIVAGIPGVKGIRNNLKSIIQMEHVPQGGPVKAAEHDLGIGDKEIGL